LNVNNWSDTSIATVPTGNGLAVTPMQMLSVYMTIANNGVHIDPRLIKGFINADGDHKDAPAAKTKRVISETTAKQVQEMLKGVVLSGTGKLASVQGYSVAGKTGTARKPPYQHPPYKYMASFVGFAPANHPRIAAIVVINEPPANKIYGGTVAAPVFSRIMQAALRVEGVTPDEDVQGKAVTNEPSQTTTTTTLPTTTPTLAPYQD
jgi:cell division protein FtsI/penicillin-binding protein 2